MNVEQIYTGCLAQGAYYVESKGEVTIIDPIREVQPYIKMAKLDDAKNQISFRNTFPCRFCEWSRNIGQRNGSKHYLWSQ